MQAYSTDSSIIYVVDDDQAVRESLKSLFDSVGLKSQAFPSATDFLSAKLPDVASCLILDVRLPGLGGLDFQDELARAKIDIPIIFITGYGDIPMSVKAMKHGAVEFLSKPIREQDLLDAVQFALNRANTHRETYLRTRDLHERYAALSAREKEVMRFVCAGLMNKQVAAEIGISEITVKVHRHNVMRKLGAKSLPDLVRMADSLDVSEKR
jgi:FixJ family two-component response regulator